MKLTENNNLPIDAYLIAKTWKRILARIIDIILTSLIPLIIGFGLSLINKNNQEWWKITLIFIINLLINIIYFIIIPWKWQGQTIGKFILQIKLLQVDNNLTFRNLVFREAFLIFIPLILTLGIIVIISLTFNENIATIIPNSITNYWLNIIIRVIVSFDFAWYSGIIIVTKIDKYHQLFYDRKNNIYTVNKKIFHEKKHKTGNNINEPHVHLGTKQPGNISDDELKNIRNL